VAEAKEKVFWIQKKSSIILISAIFLVLISQKVLFILILSIVGRHRAIHVM
jgi:hypothetical protein